MIKCPIPDLPGATIDTAFEVVTDEKSPVLTPVKEMDRINKFRKSMDKVGKRYAKSFIVLK